MIEAVLRLRMKPGAARDKVLDSLLATAEYDCANYDMVSSVDVAIDINRPDIILYIARLNSLADWEAAMTQWAEDEKVPAMTATWAEGTTDRQWFFYRIHE